MAYKIDRDIWSFPNSDATKIRFIKLILSIFSPMTKKPLYDQHDHIIISNITIMLLRRLSHGDGSVMSFKV
jgi:hypothetical protein